MALRRAMRYRDINGWHISACGALCIAVDKSSHIAFSGSGGLGGVSAQPIACPKRAVCALWRIGEHFYLKRPRIVKQ